MILTLSEFITKYTGVLCGNTPGNQGQCVGLVSLWMDNLGIAHEWGDAKNLLTNADTSKFNVITNNPNDLNQFPLPGDIMVWDDTWGNGLGHTGVITQADGNTFSAFEQNNPGAPQINNHANYIGVLGWLHPKTSQADSTTSQPQGTFVDAPTFSQLVDKSTKYDNFVSAGFVTVSDTQAKIKNLESTIDNLNQQINDRNNNITTLNGQLQSLISQAESKDMTIQTLQIQANKVPGLATELEQAISDKEACLKAEDAQQAKIKELQAIVSKVMPTGFINKLLFLFS